MIDDAGCPPIFTLAVNVTVLPDEGKVNIEGMVAVRTPFVIAVAEKES